MCELSTPDKSKLVKEIIVSQFSITFKIDKLSQNSEWLFY